MCGNYPFAEATSPGGQLTAHLFQRDCGAASGFSTQIAILASSESLPNRAGNIFIADGHPEDNNASISWQDAHTLVVVIKSEATRHLARTKYRGVNINYKSTDLE
jgi:hypothetical protein